MICASCGRPVPEGVQPIEGLPEGAIRPLAPSGRRERELTTLYAVVLTVDGVETVLHRTTPHGRLPFLTDDPRVSVHERMLELARDLMGPGAALRIVVFRRVPDLGAWGETAGRIGTAVVYALLIAAACSALLGCATSNIVMKDPRTGQIQMCQRPTFGEIRAADTCAEALERDGWVRLNR